jgi:predicted NAD/FAD-dependent oxidoreductase
MLKVTSDTTSIRSVAVIGSGLAGLTAAILLGQLGHSVTVFEKSRGPGGRMASKRVGRGSADVGAQYFTARNPEFLSFLQRWAGSDAFLEWPARFRFQDDTLNWQPFPEEKRYVGVPRMTAITRALSAHVEVTAQVRIERLERSGNQWQLVCTEGLNHGVFDQVIITAPPAQARELLLASQLDGLAKELEKQTPCAHTLRCSTGLPTIPPSRAGMIPANGGYYMPPRSGPRPMWIQSQAMSVTYWWANSQR